MSARIKRHPVRRGGSGLLPRRRVAPVGIGLRAPVLQVRLREERAIGQRATRLDRSVVVRRPRSVRIAAIVAIAAARAGAAAAGAAAIGAAAVAG